MNMLLPLLMLITIFLIDHTLGKAFSSQCNNKDIFWKQNSRGMQRAKEMLSSNQANFHRNPRKSEINDSSTFEWLSVPIPNDIPASTMGSFLSQLTVVPTSSSLHFHVPMNATSTATGLTSLNDVTIAHVSATAATTTAINDSNLRNCNYKHAKISDRQVQSNSNSTQDKKPKHSASHHDSG